VAGSGRYTVILDACVLYPRLLRDVLLSLAHADLYTARWSQDIEQEWTRSLLRHGRATEQQVAHAVEQMRTSIPDCLVEGYEPLIALVELPDSSDRHVLAAAIRGNADAIVTFNAKHFPARYLDPFGIELQTPDQFVVNQLMLHPPTALSAIKAMRERWQSPPMTAAAMLDLFEARQLQRAAAHLRDVVDLI
jgi:predicted nucleic acid-binding protein